MMVEKLIVITVLITAASLLDVELLVLHIRHALLLRKKRRRDLYWAKRPWARTGHMETDEEAAQLRDRIERQVAEILARGRELLQAARVSKARSAVPGGFPETGIRRWHNYYSVTDFRQRKLHGREPLPKGSGSEASPAGWVAADRRETPSLSFCA
jgi:hypothetical protein